MIVTALWMYSGVLPHLPHLPPHNQELSLRKSDFEMTPPTHADAESGAESNTSVDKLTRLYEPRKSSETKALEANVPL